MAPRLVIAAPTPTFDEAVLSLWRNEGFDVLYEPVTNDSRAALQRFEEIGDELEEGEVYAIVAYASAAAHLLTHAFHSPLPKLTSLIAYYPSSLPPPTSLPPKGLRIQIHLAGSQPFAPKFHYYRYEGTEPGFDLPSLGEGGEGKGGEGGEKGKGRKGVYDKWAAGVAWSRALDKVRSGLGVDDGVKEELEGVWEEHVAQEFHHRSPSSVLPTLSSSPSVLHIPTLTGALSSFPSVMNFYTHYFIPSNPPSLSIKLLSRTVGSDKLVDEMLISFDHTTEFKAVLPGVAPTGKKIEMLAVGVVTFRGGKVQAERVYWDQAGLLVQLGLLDGEREGKRLPIVSGEVQAKVVVEGEREGEEGKGGRVNELLEGWY